jgi:hypothetical protein
MSSWRDAYIIKHRDNFTFRLPRVEAGSNTSTLTLRVVGDDEKRSQSDPNITALARTRSICKRQTRPLVRERAPYQQTHNCLPAWQSALQPWVSLCLLYNQSPPGVRFLNKIMFYRMGLLAPCPTPILEDQGVSVSLDSTL